jgi:hypothetical protein
VLNVVVCCLVVVVHSYSSAITFLSSIDNCMSLNVRLCVISTYRFGIRNFNWVVLAMM